MSKNTRRVATKLALGSFLLSASCAPASQTRKVTPLRTELKRHEVLSLDRGQPRFQVNLQGDQLTLHTHDSLVCRIERTERASNRVDVTTEPDTGVVVAEAGLAAVMLSFAGVMAATGSYKQGLAKSDADSNEEGNFVLLVGLPATIGAVSAFAAGVDLSSRNFRSKVVSRERTLAPTYERCSKSALDGRPVSIRFAQSNLQSTFDQKGRAVYRPLPPSTTSSQDQTVDVYIEGTMVARVPLERSP